MTTIKKRVQVIDWTTGEMIEGWFENDYKLSDAVEEYLDLEHELQVMVLEEKISID